MQVNTLCLNKLLITNKGLFYCPLVPQKLFINRFWAFYGPSPYLRLLLPKKCRRGYGEGRALVLGFNGLNWRNCCNGLILNDMDAYAGLLDTVGWSVEKCFFWFVWASWRWAGLLKTFCTEFGKKMYICISTCIAA